MTGSGGRESERRERDGCKRNERERVMEVEESRGRKWGEVG